MPWSRTYSVTIEGGFRTANFPNNIHIQLRFFRLLSVLCPAHGHFSYSSGDDYQMLFLFCGPQQNVPFWHSSVYEMSFCVDFTILPNLCTQALVYVHVCVCECVYIITCVQYQNYVYCTYVYVYVYT